MTANTSSFQKGSAHPRFMDDAAVVARVNGFDMGSLYATGNVEQRSRSRRYVELCCRICQRTSWVCMDTLATRKTCRCQSGKYHDVRARMLGARYDAMVQRCERETHVSWKHYKGRGIRVLFTSREDFVTWALEKWPTSTFRGLDFDRIDNDGDYSRENLRLVTRSVNVRNGRRWDFTRKVQ